ncbi:MAG: GIY-YIG nuclease family protein [Deltaproteobacteria bacterium]|nr:GIY-YIG nuclease family protein [Deltaproteobacteria bacterium]
MYYVYVLRSLKKNWLYTGYSNDFKRRIEEHRNGMVVSTKPYLPVELVYYEASLFEDDAKAREKYLKSGFGKKYLKNRIKSYLKNCVTICDRA